MLDEISATQLREWEQYAEEEPFGQIRQDYLLGTLNLAIFNYLRGEGQPPFTLEEILYPEKQAEKEEAAAVDLAFVESLVASGKVVDMRKHKVKK